MASKFISSLIFSFLLAMVPKTCLGKKSGLATLNAIDVRWRQNPNWINSREDIVKYSAGFAGKMFNNIGKDVNKYITTDPSDNVMSPKPRTLRYVVTMVPGKVWISFQKDMDIKLERTLVVGSYITNDGRGVIVHIIDGCLMLYKVLMNMNGKNTGKGIWNFKSVGDVLENGASFNEIGLGFVKPNYNNEQRFPVESGRITRQLTRSGGALRCQSGSIC